MYKSALLYGLFVAAFTFVLTPVFGKDGRGRGRGSGMGWEAERPEVQRAQTRFGVYYGSPYRYGHFGGPHRYGHYMPYYPSYHRPYYHHYYYPERPYYHYRW